jgi:hypothetical protein
MLYHFQTHLIPANARVQTRRSSRRALLARTRCMLLLVAAAACASPDVRLDDATVVSRSTSVGTAPMFTVSPNGSHALAWVSAPDGGTDGRVYLSIDGAEPVELRDSLGPIEPHGESPPKIAFGRDGALHVLYVVSREVPDRRFPAGALRMQHTVDGGTTWEGPVTVTDDSTFGSHNFHALHVGGDGAVYVSWLDGRHGKAAVYLTRSTDGGRTFEPNRRVSIGEACPCCRTALASGSDGTLYIAWRTVLPGSVRDIAVARSMDGGATWSSARRVHADDWVFEACPHAGPALAVDSSGALHVAWWTGKVGMAGVYYARSSDRAETFSAPVALGVTERSRPAHVQLALRAGRNTIAAVWDDGTLPVSRVVMRISEDGGESFGGSIPLSAEDRAAGFPVLGIVGDSVVVAWSEQPVAAAERAESMRPDLRNPDSVMPLHAVGNAQVMVRRDALP